jgi:hypothetical protein
VIVPNPEEPPAAWVRDVAPDVKTNNIEPTGRILLIIMDDATLPPAAEFVNFGKQSARRVVELMGPADLAAVVFTWNNRNAQDFTADRARLLAAIDKFSYAYAFDFVKIPGPPDIVKMRDPFLEYEYSVKTLRSAVEYLGTISQRRKAIIYVSVGIHISPQRNPYIWGLMHDTFALALRSNVNVYGVDPGGLSGLEAYIKLRQLPLDSRLFREYLQIMSDNTGGFVIVNDNDPAAQVERIRRHRFVLPARVSTDRQDGRFRRIQVRGTGRVRRSAIETATTPIGHHLWLRGRAIAAASTSDRHGRIPAQRGRAHAGDGRAVRDPGSANRRSRLSRGAAAGRARAHSAAGRAADERVRSRGQGERLRRQSARVLLPTEAPDAEYEVLSRVELRPGRYQLRIAADHPALKKSGSVYCDVEIPDFSKTGLWLSVCVLSSTPAAGVTAGRPVVTPASDPDDGA